MPPSDSDFDSWNERIKRIQTFRRHKTYTEGEIWWCSLGVNVGFEQNGTGVSQERPVLVLKRLNKQTCYVVPLTTSIKQGAYRIEVGTVDGKEAKALLDQIRLIDTKRLSRIVTKMDPCIFLYIREVARKLF